MSVNIAITEKNRLSVAKLLNILLADEYVLYTKTRKYHWNVKGMMFNDLHKFFETQYEKLDEIIDEVAERVRALGHYAAGSMTQFLKLTRLLEHTDDSTDAGTMLQNLLDDHETLIRMLRKDLETANKHKDAGTSDFLTGLLEEHEKMAWMLRSFLDE